MTFGFCLLASDLRVVRTLCPSSFIIKLSPGLRVDILPDSVAVSDTSCSSEGGWAKTAEGVSFYYIVRVLKADYSVGEFPKLKASIDAITRPQFREVYFLK